MSGNTSLQKNFLLGVFTLFLAGIITISFSENSHAEDLNFSIKGGASLPQDDGLEDGSYFAAVLSYSFTENLEIGIESGYSEYDVKGPRTSGLNPGKVVGVPILATAKLKYPFKGENIIFTPYISGAIGATYWEWRDIQLAGFEFNADDDFEFMARAGVGFDLEFNDSFKVFIEGNYNWSDYNIAFSGTSVGEAELDSVFVGGGATLSF